MLHFVLEPSEDLASRLIKFDVPVSLWGQGSAKTVEHLYSEIEAGDSEIVEESKKLVRYVHFVNVEVVARFGGQLHRLVEDRQVFTDGRTRRREDLGGAVKEKIHPSEDPDQAVDRALKEELQVEGKIQKKKLRTESLDKESPSYPGLRSKYKAHFFEAELFGNQIKQEGYQEVQPDKTTFFIWQDV